MDWRVVIAQLHSETEIVAAVILLPRTLSSCINTEPCREQKKKDNSLLLFFYLLLCYETGISKESKRHTACFQSHLKPFQAK